MKLNMLCVNSFEDDGESMNGKLNELKSSKSSTEQQNSESTPHTCTHYPHKYTLIAWNTIRTQDACDSWALFTHSISLSSKFCSIYASHIHNHIPTHAHTERSCESLLLLLHNWVKGWVFGGGGGCCVTTENAKTDDLLLAESCWFVAIWYCSVWMFVRPHSFTRPHNNSKEDR